MEALSRVDSTPRARAIVDPEPTARGDWWQCTACPYRCDDVADALGHVAPHPGWPFDHLMYEMGPGRNALNPVKRWRRAVMVGRCPQIQGRPRSR